MSLISRPFGLPSDAWKSNSPLDLWRSPTDAWGLTRPMDALSMMASPSPLATMSMLPAVQDHFRTLRNLGMSDLMSCDIVEGPKEYRIVAELPGVPADACDISVDGNMLNIRAERRNDFEQDDFMYHRKECQSGRVERQFQIPLDAVADKMSASFLHGRLTVTIPRSSTSSTLNKRQIPIVSSNGSEQQQQSGAQKSQRGKN